jgi:hypothetical protein
VQYCKQKFANGCVGARKVSKIHIFRETTIFCGDKQGDVLHIHFVLISNKHKAQPKSADVPKRISNFMIGMGHTVRGSPKTVLKISENNHIFF